MSEFKGGLVPVGKEFQVSTDVSLQNILKDYLTSALVSLAGGGYFAVWMTRNALNNGGNLYGQKLDSKHQKVGEKVLISHPYSHGHVAAERLSDDSIIVIWDGDGICAKKYNSKIEPIGDMFQIFTNSLCHFLEIKAFDKGGFVVFGFLCPSIKEIIAQKFYNSGKKLGGEIELVQQDDPRNALSVDTFSDGSFLIARSGGLRKNAEFYVNKFDAEGNSSELVVAPCLNFRCSYAIVKAFSDGGFIIAWNKEYDNYGIDNQYSIYAKKYNSEGKEIGSEVELIPFKKNTQDLQDIQILEDNSFVIVWNADDGSDNGVYAKRFSSDWMSVGSEFIVNNHTLGNQLALHERSISYQAAAQELLLMWTSREQDGGGNAFYAQCLSSSISPIKTPSPFTLPEPILQAGQTGDISLPSYAKVDPGNRDKFFGTAYNEAFMIDADKMVIYGGDGVDQFIIKPRPGSQLRIADFQSNEVIDLSDFKNIKCFEDLAMAEGEAVISLPNKQFVIIDNVGPSEINKNHFIFSLEDEGGMIHEKSMDNA